MKERLTDNQHTNIKRIIVPDREVLPEAYIQTLMKRGVEKVIASMEQRENVDSYTHTTIALCAPEKYAPFKQKMSVMLSSELSIYLKTWSANTSMVEHLVENLRIIDPAAAAQIALPEQLFRTKYTKANAPSHVENELANKAKFAALFPSHFSEIKLGEELFERAAKELETSPNQISLCHNLQVLYPGRIKKLSIHQDLVQKYVASLENLEQMHADSIIVDLRNLSMLLADGISISQEHGMQLIPAKQTSPQTRKEPLPQRKNY